MNTKEIQAEVKKLAQMLTDADIVQKFEINIETIEPQEQRKEVIKMQSERLPFFNHF